MQIVGEYIFQNKANPFRFYQKEKTATFHRDGRNGELLDAQPSRGRELSRGGLSRPSSDIFLSETNPGRFVSARKSPPKLLPSMVSENRKEGEHARNIRYFGSTQNAAVEKGR